MIEPCARDDLLAQVGAHGASIARGMERGELLRQIFGIVLLEEEPLA